MKKMKPSELGKAPTSDNGQRVDSNNEGSTPYIPSARKGSWKPAWTSYIYKSLDHAPVSQLMSRNISSADLSTIGCPMFSSLSTKEKKKFWAIYISSMSHYEGEHNPKEFYDEDGTNDSYGLLQIDAPNARAKGCVKDNGQPPSGGKYGREAGGDMYDPLVNIKCSMVMLNRQLGSSRLFTNKGYWAIQRPNRPGYKKFVPLVRSQLKQVRGCSGSRMGEMADSKNSSTDISDGFGTSSGTDYNDIFKSNSRAIGI